MIKNISNLGDAALYCDFGNEVNKSINSQVIKYFKTIKEKKFEGINNLTPSYNKLIISYDLKKTNFKEVKNYVENINAKDSNMRAQRLETPRVKVPKGSVALTEQFANIYTFESPGGWNILGNTPLDVFDSSKEDKPNLINPGDTVIFKEITLDQYKNYNE